MRRGSLPRFAVATLLVLVTGCAHVAPWEREHLARPSMDFSREGKEIAFRSHVHESREGAMGGNGAAGGGCGCN